MTDGRFHLDKTINLGHLLTTIGMVVAVAAGWFNFDKRLALVEQRQQAQEQALTQSMEQLRGDVRELKVSIDKLIQRELDKR